MNKIILVSIFVLGLGGIFIFREEDFLPLRIICIMMSVVSAIFLEFKYPVFTSAWSVNYSKKIELRKKANNLKLRGTNKERAFIRVQNAINNKKVFASLEEDGVYIRLAGNENEGEAYTEKKVKIYDYEK